MSEKTAVFADMAPERVAQVEDLSVVFRGSERTVEAVKHLSFHVDRGETLAIVGESGSGKSVTSLALMRLVEYGGGCIAGGRLGFRRRGGQTLDIAQCSGQQMRAMRGADLAMIFQEPMTSLNPVFPVGEQIAESIRLHQGLGAEQARAQALRMLDQVRIPDAKNVLGRYPHQLSGGMRQRVMIAMALACKPALLIADEPTKALDVTVQAQILQLIRELQREMQMGVMFITHDMGVVAEVADRVLVMLRGEAVEEGPSQQIFDAPAHPYTRALLAAVPRLGSMSGTDLPERFPLLGGTDVAQPMPPASPETRDCSGSTRTSKSSRCSRKATRPAPTVSAIRSSCARAKFQDGTDFNAEAVKVNLDRVLDKSNGLARYNQFNRIKSVTVVDPYTVKIELNEPFSALINALAHPSAMMISPTALKKWGKDIALHPVGTGPFEFVEWKPAEYLKVKKFDGYWRKGYPKIDTLTFRTVTDNNTRAAVVQTGEAQFAYPVPYEQASLLKANPKLELVATPSITTRYVSMNTLQKPFDDVRVREAVNYAINKDALAKVAFAGYAFPAQGVVPQGVAFAEKMAPWPYDPAKALGAV